MYEWWPGTPEPGESSADRFCRMACLTYDRDDDPQRRRDAAALFAADSGIVDVHIWAAATAANADAVQRHLDADPGAAARLGGPYHWSPLFYLTYSRLDPQVAAEPVLRITGRLLAAGADPHEGYLWRGLPSPFTLLTGAFGEGEQGPVAQPRHPHSIELAREFLAAGTDPNDAQALYNRMFGSDDDHLEVLLAAGLGRGDGGVWRQRLGTTLPDPAELLRDQVRWAVEHDQRSRVALLLSAGFDPNVRFADGRTPAQVAAALGNDAVRDAVLASGGDPTELDPVEAFIGAVLAGSDPNVDEDVLAAARQCWPGVLVWAAGQGRIDAVAVLLRHGFDVNARGRADVPRPGTWETALHAAVAADRADVVALLLRYGADPTIEDERFHATPAGWAEHFGHAATGRLLTL